MSQAALLLLGAGASRAAGVPTAVDLTRHIEEKFAGTEYARVLRFVLAGCLFQQGVRGANPLNGVDVEELLSAVQLLASRHTLEAAPFIAAWHPHVDLLDVKIGAPSQMGELMQEIAASVTEHFTASLPPPFASFPGRGIDEGIAQAIRQGSDYSIDDGVVRLVRSYLDRWLEGVRQHRVRSASSYFGDVFSTAVTSSQPQPATGGVFQELADAIHSSLVDLLYVTAPEKVEYLQAIASYARAMGGVTVATLNYDNSIELMASTYGVECDTGISTWTAGERYQVASHAHIKLLKLHGSIDWAEGTAAESPLKIERIVCVPIEDARKHGMRPSIIFGARNKLTAKGPFLAILQAFHESLESTDRVVVVGYSFRDDHINLALRSWLARSEENQLVVVDPSLGTSTPPFVEQVRKAVPTQLRLEAATAEAGLSAVLETK